MGIWLPSCHITVAFRKLYTRIWDLRIEAMQRHTSFFNCNEDLVWGHLLLDWLWRWKNRRHWELNLIMMQSPQVKPDWWSTFGYWYLDTGVMLPCYCVAVDFAKGGNWVIPLVFSLVMAIIVFGISRFSFYWVIVRVQVQFSICWRMVLSNV